MRNSDGVLAGNARKFNFVCLVNLAILHYSTLSYTILNPEDDINQSKRRLKIKMLFGVTIILYFLKILSGSRNYCNTDNSVPWDTEVIIPGVSDLQM